MTNVLCRVRPSDRYSQKFDFGFELPKPVSQEFVLYEMYFKSGQSAWRQIISLKDVDACAVLNDNKNSILFMKEFKKLVQKLFPNLPTKCPYKPGKYYNRNTKVDNQSGVYLTNSLTNKIFPNGEYRHNIRLYTRADPQGLLMLIYHEVYERMNDETW